MASVERDLPAETDLVDVVSRNMRDLLDDSASAPELRAAIQKLAEALHKSPEVHLGWSSMID